MEAFLAGTVSFPRIAATIEDAVTRWGAPIEPDLDGIFELDAEVRGALSIDLGIGDVA